jgi:hypothetical protein
MRKVCLLILVAVVVFVGCHTTRPQTEPTFSYYHAPQFQWERVGRVLVLPFNNETSFPHVGEEVQNSLVTEWQQMGLFEVVPAPVDMPVALAHVVRENGRFNEVVLIQLARMYRADAIVMGTVTQYSPYTLPRLGLALQVISPGDATVAASVDGLWDAANLTIAQRARAYYRQHTKPRDEPFTVELVLESPQLYQRFVCCEAVSVLIHPTPPPVITDKPRPEVKEPIRR